MNDEIEVEYGSASDDRNGLTIITN